MKQKNYQKGRRGEDIAESFLVGNGFSIIKKNFHTRFGEIDLVAARGTTLHFVEVKLKVGTDFGTPEEMIDKRKIRQVMKTGEAYLLQNRRMAAKFAKTQVDAVCIVVDQEGNKERVNYYENLTFEL